MTHEPTNEHPASYLDVVDYRDQVIGGMSLSFGSGGVVLQFYASIERTTTTELPDIRNFTVLLMKMFLISRNNFSRTSVNGYAGSLCTGNQNNTFYLWYHLLPNTGNHVYIW